MAADALSYLVPLGQRSRMDATLEALSTMISQSNMQVGDKLPAETQLAQQLGVSRSTMREALNRWEGLGLIRRRRGDGTYLTAGITRPTGSVPISIQLEGEQILRWLEMRRCLEAATARKASERATPAQRRALIDLCERLLHSVESEQPSEVLDSQFHTAIADATGNPVFGLALRQVKQAMVSNEGSPFAERGFARASFPLHRDLALAIRDGDADAAEAAVHAIIDVVEAEINAKLMP